MTESLRRSSDDWLPAIVDRIVRLVDPARIVLFGSRAAAHASADSDYDLLVVLDDVGHRRETRIAIARSLADLPSKDIVVTTRAETERRASLVGVVRWALDEGRTVYERPPQTMHRVTEGRLSCVRQYFR
ncbi:MAG TPA: nucleotidyltransferase domain-containing protein [Candidatus Limnocylindrales bacterium]|nr:nucleotidyltransferase domain-containing protein [Candidatus Limnocylindrales bacterium]